MTLEPIILQARYQTVKDQSNHRHSRSHNSDSTADNDQCCNKWKDTKTFPISILFVFQFWQHSHQGCLHYCTRHMYSSIYDQ